MKQKNDSFSKLLIPIWIVGLILFAGLVAFTSYTAYNKEQENIKDYTHARMKTLILDLETKLMSIESELVAQSHRSHITLGDTVFLFSCLEQMIGDQPYMTNASVDIWKDSICDTISDFVYVRQEKDGTFWHSFTRNLLTEDDSTVMACFYKAAQSQKPEWSRPYLDTIWAKSCVITCYVISENRRVMCGTDVKLNTLLKTIDSLQFYENSKMYIVVPGSMTYTLEDGDLVATQGLHVDEQKYIKIPVHYRRLNIDIVNVVPKDKIYNSLWNRIFVVFIFFIVGLTLLAHFVHKSFNRAQNDLADSIKKAEEEKMALKKIEDEVAIAARIQNQMLTAPGKSAHFAGLPDSCQHPYAIDLVSQIIPAREVGGDLYEYRIEGNNLVVCVGDVSGKGIPASIIMANCITLFHAYVSDHTETHPSDLLRYMNTQQCRRNEEMMFVTMWVGVLNLTTGVLRYASAGHNPPVLINLAHQELSANGQWSVANGNACFLELCQGLPLGMFEDASYPMRECHLGNYQTLLLYTDGITEAENDAHELFGDERLLEACRSVSSLCPGIVCRSVLQAVERHTSGCSQSDDITLLCLSFGNHYAQLHGIDEIKAIHTLVAECSSTDEAALVLEEAAVNAFNHGGASFVGIEFKDERFIMTSDGDDFNPTTYPVPEHKDGELTIGGRGIPLMRMLCSEITYHRTDDGLSILVFALK